MFTWSFRGIARVVAFGASLELLDWRRCRLGGGQVCTGMGGVFLPTFAGLYC